MITWTKPENIGRDDLVLYRGEWIPRAEAHPRLMAELRTTSPLAYIVGAEPILEAAERFGTLDAQITMTAPPLKLRDPREIGLKRRRSKEFPHVTRLALEVTLTGPHGTVTAEADTVEELGRKLGEAVDEVMRATGEGPT